MKATKALKDTKDNLTIIKESYAAGACGDIPGMLKDLTDTASWTEVAGGPYGGVYHGSKETLEQVFSRIRDDWGTSFACIPEQIYDMGDIVVMTGWYQGTHLETGRSFKIRVAHVWQLEQGRIVAFEQFADSAGMLKAMPQNKA